MDDLSNESLDDFLEAVAEAEPAPGGGTSSAVTTALAAALVEMAARIGGADDEGAEADDDDGSAGPATRAAELRAEALRLEEANHQPQRLSARSPHRSLS